ncbi:MAG: hypothetical protein LPJ94_03755 [Thauera sp.]|nr:hypothetical protein [Thauera sp.]
MGGRTTYQAEPCPVGTKQSDLAGGSISVVSPPSPREQLARIQALGRPTDERSGPAMAFIETETQAAERAECQRLRNAIDQVDAQGRQRNTAQSVEWLRERRREYVKRANELDCSRMSGR